MNSYRFSRLFTLVLLLTAGLLVACGSADTAVQETESSGMEPSTSANSAASLIDTGTEAEEAGDTAVAPAAPANNTIAVDTSSITTDAKGLTVGFTTDGYPFRGNPSAPVVIETYSDFQCPFCGRFTEQTLGVLEEKTKGNLTEEEAGEISGVLHELRSRFVELMQIVAKQQAGGAAGQPGGPTGPMPPQH